MTMQEFYKAGIAISNHTGETLAEIVAAPKKEPSIVTYNSKFDINGNRLNLVVNHDKRELFFYGCNAYNLGTEYSDCGIREVNRLHKEFIADGYKPVSHAEVRDNWK
jgi:hypothetical protein